MAEAQAPEKSETPDMSNLAILHHHITLGIERATGALEEVRKVVVDFDARHQATETAHSYLSGAIGKAQNALEDLSKTAVSLKDGASEIPVRALSTALANVSSAFTHITDGARKYDDQFQLSTKLSQVINGPREQAALAIAAAASYAAAWAAAANAQLQGVSDGLRATLVHGFERALPTAVRADETLHVTELATAASAAMLQKAKELDERFGLSGYVGVAVGHAQTLDQRITGGKVTPAIMTAYQAGLRMAGYVHDRFEETKRIQAAASAAPAEQPSK